MKNIFWISSYPKSGNTLVRLFLASYFFTNDGKIKDLKIVNNICGFNNVNIFNKINDICENSEFIKDPSLISKYWFSAQETLYKLHPKKVFFFKTHNSFVKYRNYSFTNENFTRGVIYVVRDPRSVLVSAKYHYNYANYEIGFNYLQNNNHVSIAKDQVLPEFLLSWKEHYLSWKNFINKNPKIGIIIKFEDLLDRPKKKFRQILSFIKDKHDIEINNEKFNNAVQSVNFNNLQTKEKKYGFVERGPDAEKFFREGRIDEWKTKVPKKIIQKIENNYKKEMIELGYL